LTSLSIQAKSRERNELTYHLAKLRKLSQPSSSNILLFTGEKEEIEHCDGKKLDNLQVSEYFVNLVFDKRN
jgi:hypothetical protein